MTVNDHFHILRLLNSQAIQLFSSHSAFPGLFSSLELWWRGALEGIFRLRFSLLLLSIQTGHIILNYLDLSYLDVRVFGTEVSFWGRRCCGHHLRGSEAVVAGSQGFGF